jgi:drug/metabolite transporter (DMT)-like permease
MAGRILLLIFGVWACSTAVIMIKAGTMHPVLLSASRLLVATAALSPVFLRDLRRNRSRYSRRHLRRTILPGIVLGAHFVSWILGARLTLAANSSLIVNMVPVVMPFLLHFMMREQLNRGEWLGTAVALMGVLVLAGLDYHISAEYFLGDVLCFGSMLLFALYLALGRRNRDFPTLWLYLVPLYFVGGLVCLLTAAGLGALWEIPAGRDFLQAVRLGEVHPLAIHGAWDVLLAVGLGIIPTIIGHSTLNWAMKHIRGQAVSIANLGQFIFAGVMAYFLLGEAPAWNFYVACALVVAGAGIALRQTPSRHVPRPVPPPE